MEKVLEIDAAIIGGGPAGLMAADVLSKAGIQVHVFEAKPSLARKFLMAGKSGLNLSKKQEPEVFLKAYRHDSDAFEKALFSFLPKDVENWCTNLGIETYYGSSGRLFPKVMKASPLLRAWLLELDERGVSFSTRHLWKEFRQGFHYFETSDGILKVKAKATVFALGGKSWARLGSDGNWEKTFDELGIKRAPFKPSNCGFICQFDEHFKTRFSGAAVKNVILKVGEHVSKGDFVVTEAGIEGGALYPLSWALRDNLMKDENASLTIDLKPDRDEKKLLRRLQEKRGKNSFSNHLRKKTGLTGVKAGLLRLVHPDCASLAPEKLAHYIKNLELPVTSPRPIDEAISTAGGVLFSEMMPSFMLKNAQGIFLAGEMLDFDAPTGGYLLTACFATGKAAGEGAVDYLKSIQQPQ